ncbi:hypothetical protein GALMADRAFT_555276 [Galerina marginata CBS 339.88]|uniref:THO1-MOS11 C-terminal domain-containing protein n=1 Tax=Galerina marginata (strain CBS 339.88) TaxID=685588 RepID=A0A067T687_GALM3|nr:hypothetical protein GALMADRAFT_555276 [Galerina marginata CBS 339.88]
MDAKLKALKVVDLKQILAKAHVVVPAKATKNDLIARIQASKPALDVYAALYPQDDLLAPPEEVDWNVDQLDSPPQEKHKPAPSTSDPAPPPPAPAATPAAPIPVSAPTAAAADDELEKKRQRAARFGIPFVEPQQKRAKPIVPGVDPKKLEERAARFGIPAVPPTATNGKKRAAPHAAEVDPEELERRKKRAERFGLANKA